MFKYIRKWVKENKIKNAPCNEARILIKYMDGDILNDLDRNLAYSLASMGFVHLGTNVEIDNKMEKIKVSQTAKTTNLGKGYLLTLY